MGKIYLKPFGGLGNRMLALASGMQLAADYGKELIVLWDKRRELYAPFNDLFRMPGLQIREADKLFLPSLRKRLDPFPQENSFFVKLRAMAGLAPYDQAIYSDIFYSLVPSAGRDDLDAYFNELTRAFSNYLHQRPLKKNVFIASCLRFMDVTNTLPAIQPSDEVAAAVDQIYGDLRAPAIGLHIRRGDHKLAAEKSPLDAFRQIIERETTAEPSVRFFLATDSRDVENTLTSQYPNIVYRSKDFSRKSAAGVRDAFIDLLALSRAGKIYGSYWSTFSYVAGLIGGKPVEVVNR